MGSLTQMATIRLGKRTDDNTPLIKDFVPLTEMDDLVFGAWDPISDNGYESAVNAGVLKKEEHLDPIKDFLSSIEPMPAVFDTDYVKKVMSERMNAPTFLGPDELAIKLDKDYEMIAPVAKKAKKK